MPIMDDRFAAAAPLPARLSRLHDLATDLWWSWDTRARAMFRRLDTDLWHQTAHNPVRMLQRISAARLRAAAEDPAFLLLFDEAVQAREGERERTHPWWAQHGGSLAGGTVAYFSAEFALHPSLPIYAGGLGVLAGDHCKEASDLGVPLVGVGFMYPQGYFHQRMSQTGWQEERYERVTWTEAPIAAALTPEGRACTVKVPLGDRTVHVAVWCVRLARVRLYLLDTDLPENAPWDRELSARLYGGDRDTRLQQEAILGVGGVLALRALGIAPTVWHLNEGHAGFVIFERLREHRDRGHSFDQALAAVRAQTVFTTHTPVAAGHDAFAFHQVERALASCWRDRDGDREQFLALGAYDSGHGPQFNMTALAMRGAAHINGVSQLHGAVTRDMWAPLWPDTPASARPVRAITNGVHMPTWLATPISELITRYAGAGWLDRSDEGAVWDALLEIPDRDLWAARTRQRHDLFAFIRERLRTRWVEDQVTPNRIVAAGAMLDPEVLTIGYARRFTAYKRPELIFHDVERLARLLTRVGRPVQVVFAGKAHPADEPAKHHLQRVFRHCLDPAFGGRIAFIDDYDMLVARYLVHGCDVWLNNPRKPLEASGTSGMKAAMNGVPHLSVGDGWWAEGYTGDNGWLISAEADPADPAATDAAEADALYTLLENEVVPRFYARTADGVPQDWLRVVREAMRTSLIRFSTRRMLKQYVLEMYGPASLPPVE
jgi:starch phosphorylase